MQISRRQNKIISGERGVEARPGRDEEAAPATGVQQHEEDHAELPAGERSGKNFLGVQQHEEDHAELPADLNDQVDVSCRPERSGKSSPHIVHGVRTAHWPANFHTHCFHAQVLVQSTFSAWKDRWVQRRFSKMEGLGRVMGQYREKALLNGMKASEAVEYWSSLRPLLQQSIGGTWFLQCFFSSWKDRSAWDQAAHQHCISTRWRKDWDTSVRTCLALLGLPPVVSLY